MSDADVKRYARELDRQGLNSREIAAGILGVTLDRYMLLARMGGPSRVEGLGREQLLLYESHRPTEPEPRWRRVTGVNAAGPFNVLGAEQELWRALWALPFTAFEELQRVAVTLNARGVEICVWDAHAFDEPQEPRGDRGLIVEWFGRAAIPWSYDRVEDGWRTPRDGPPVIPDVTPIMRPWGRGVGALCPFCDAAIATDRVSCSCPPCVSCGGSHPAVRCPDPHAERRRIWNLTHGEANDLLTPP